MSEIVQISRIEQQLAQAVTPAEVRGVVFDIDLLLKIAGDVGMMTEQVNELQVMRIKSIRLGGEILAGLDRGKAGRPELNSRSDFRNLSPYKQATEDASLSMRMARYWQHLAAIPEDIWETYQDGCIASNSEMSMFGFLVYSKPILKERLRAARLEGFLQAGHAMTQVSVRDIQEGLPLADNSVDVILTDPPYPREFLPLYETLGSEAARILKPGGTLAVMCGQSYLPDIYRLLSLHLTYQWTFAYLTPGGQSAQLWERKINTFWKPVLWFVKGEYSGEWKGDVSSSAANDKRDHDWQQDEDGMADLVERFSQPGDLIVDPFVGAGTTGIAALRLKRKFIGFDNDPQAVAITQGRLADAE
jgi:16S rRNA G966 N2-methylase RsmD